MKISQADKDFAATATPVNYKKLTKTENGYRDERFEISLEYVRNDQGFKYVIGGEVESRFSPKLKEMQKMAFIIIQSLEVSEVAEEVEEIEEWICSCGCDVDPEDGICEQCGKQN